jgi:hypothetical protein
MDDEEIFPQPESFDYRAPTATVSSNTVPTVEKQADQDLSMSRAMCLH